MQQKLRSLYDALFSAFGPQGWWPIAGVYSKGDYSHPLDEREAFEVCVGAILTQNTAWKNVEKALGCLREKKRLSLDALISAPQQEVAECIRSSGYFNQKAAKLKNFGVFLRNNNGLQKVFGLPVDELRSKLLSVKGIGPETADSIILYSAKKPKFVVDAYTRRIISRVGLLSEEAGYEAFQRLFEEGLPRDLQLFNEYHALLVELAKQNCTAKAPRCASCPIKSSCAFGLAVA